VEGNPSWQLAGTAKGDEIRHPEDCATEYDGPANPGSFRSVGIANHRAAELARKAHIRNPGSSEAWVVLGRVDFMTPSESVDRTPGAVSSGAASKLERASRGRVGAAGGIQACASRKISTDQLQTVTSLLLTTEQQRGDL